MDVIVVQSMVLGMLMLISLAFLTKRFKLAYAKRAQKKSTKVVSMADYQARRRKIR